VNCPDIRIHKKLQVPSQTLFALETEELPFFQRDELVFFLSEDVISIWNNLTIEKYRRRGENSFRIVFIKHEQDPEYDYRSMEYLFESMWLSGVVQSAVLLVGRNNSSSRIYSYLPFENSSLCENTSPVYVGECSRSVIEEALDRTRRVRSADLTRNHDGALYCIYLHHLSFSDI